MKLAKNLMSWVLTEMEIYMALTCFLKAVCDRMNVS